MDVQHGQLGFTKGSIVA
ncbi:DUF645 family protein [Vibrio vulnificus]|nr:MULTISPECIES: DUF645 family protein [Vibrio]MCU8322150.1 DUF645 family protein [Vibrio vulnificus]MCU8373987.1 DUF645 family protein [Vibrio vulnificus]